MNRQYVALPRSCDIARRRLDPCEGVADFLSEAPPEIGKDNGAVDAMEELDAKLTFQRLNAVTYGGRSHT